MVDMCAPLDSLETRNRYPVALSPKNVSNRQLNGPRFQCRIGAAEERRAQRSHNAVDVGVVDRVKCIHTEFKAVPFELCTLLAPQQRNTETLGKTQIKLCASGSASGVASHASWTIIRHRIAVIVKSRCDVEWRGTHRRKY